MNHPDTDGTDAAIDEVLAARHMARAVGLAQVAGDPWDMVRSRVASRRRRRRALTAGTSTAAVTGVVAVMLSGGLTGLSATSARLSGPAGYPESTATTTFAPSDQAFAYYTDAKTFNELLADGPDRATVSLLEEAEDLLLRDCMQVGGSDYTPLDRQAAYDARAGERDVRQRALQRQADAFGDPAHAAEHGYGIDRAEWTRVVAPGPGGDGGPVAGPRSDEGLDRDEDLDLVSDLLGGPEEARMQIELESGSTLDVPGAGCLFESQSALWGDYVQATRSRDKVTTTMYPENLRQLVSFYDPQLRAADVEWSSCMADKGWRGLPDQTQAFSLVWDEYWGTGRDDAAQVEREVAVADAECVVDTGYAATLTAAETRLVDQLTQDPDIVAYGALVEAALPRARAVVLAEAQRLEVGAPAGPPPSAAELQSQAAYVDCMLAVGYDQLSAEGEISVYRGDGTEITDADEVALEVAEATEGAADTCP